MKQPAIVWKHKVNCNKLLYKYVQEIPEKAGLSRTFISSSGSTAFFFMESKAKSFLSILVKPVTCKKTPIPLKKTPVLFEVFQFPFHIKTF